MPSGSDCTPGRNNAVERQVRYGRAAVKRHQGTRYKGRELGSASFSMQECPLWENGGHVKGRTENMCLTCGMVAMSLVAPLLEHIVWYSQKYSHVELLDHFL